LQGTVGFIRGVCDVLAQEHSEAELPATLITWFSESFGIERFSYMTPDQRGETLQIAMSRGISNTIAERVRVRVGQGISGWVAHNRKPLLLASGGQPNLPPPHQDNFNPDSFLCVPLRHNHVPLRVLNLANQKGGPLFGQPDLDRATLLAQFIAMSQE